MTHTIFETEWLMLEVYGDTDAMRWVGDGIPVSEAQRIECTTSL